MRDFDAAAGREIFNGEHGDSSLWAERPLNPVLIEYAAADVEHLFSLYEAYEAAMPNSRLEELSLARIAKTVKRSDDSQVRAHSSAVKDFKLKRNKDYNRDPSD